MTIEEITLALNSIDRSVAELESVIAHRLDTAYQSGYLRGVSEAGTHEAVTEGGLMQLIRKAASLHYEEEQKWTKTS